MKSVKFNLGGVDQGSQFQIRAPFPARDLQRFAEGCLSAFVIPFFYIADPTVQRQDASRGQGSRGDQLKRAGQKLRHPGVVPCRRR